MKVDLNILTQARIESCTPMNYLSLGWGTGVLSISQSVKQCKVLKRVKVRIWSSKHQIASLSDTCLSEAELRDTWGTSGRKTISRNNVTVAVLVTNNSAIAIPTGSRAATVSEFQGIFPW